MEVYVRAETRELERTIESLQILRNESHLAEVRSREKQARAQELVDGLNKTLRQIEAERDTARDEDCDMGEGSERKKRK